MTYFPLAPPFWVMSFEFNGRLCVTHSPVAFHVMMNHLRRIRYEGEVNQTVIVRNEILN